MKINLNIRKFIIVIGPVLLVASCGGNKRDNSGITSSTMPSETSDIPSDLSGNNLEGYTSETDSTDTITYEKSFISFDYPSSWEMVESDKNSDRLIHTDFLSKDTTVTVGLTAIYHKENTEEALQNFDALISSIEIKH